jgi:hypothetical protein
MGAPHPRQGLAGESRRPKAHLTVLFMAASPEGQQPLDFEGEERAILQATSGLPVEVVVEETGTARELGQHLAGEQPVAALHLSCHGSAKGPALALEDFDETGVDRGPLAYGALPVGASLCAALRRFRTRCLYSCHRRRARDRGFDDGSGRGALRRPGPLRWTRQG